MNWLQLSVGLAVSAMSLSIIIRVIFLFRTTSTLESEPQMPEINKDEVPPVGLSDLLSSLKDATESKIGDVIDLNQEIVIATRKMAHNILKLRQAHIEEAERLHAIAADLIDSALVSSTIAADLIDVEFGGQLFDPKEFLSQVEEDFGGEDDEEEDE